MSLKFQDNSYFSSIFKTTLCAVICRRMYVGSQFKKSGGKPQLFSPPQFVVFLILPSACKTPDPFIKNFMVKNDRNSINLAIYITLLPPSLCRSTCNLWAISVSGYKKSSSLLLEVFGWENWILRCGNTEQFSSFLSLGHDASTKTLKNYLRDEVVFSMACSIVFWYQTCSVSWKVDDVLSCPQP